MATETVIPAKERCKTCINDKRSFVLHGGAGSGKTETLKRIVGIY